MAAACSWSWRGPGLRGQERPPSGDDLGPVQDPSEGQHGPHDLALANGSLGSCFHFLPVPGEGQVPSGSSFMKPWLQEGAVVSGSGTSDS